VVFCLELMPLPLASVKSRWFYLSGTGSPGPLNGCMYRQNSGGIMCRINRRGGVRGVQIGTRDDRFPYNSTGHAASGLHASVTGFNPCCVKMPRSGPCCLLELSLSRQAARNAADGVLIFCFRFIFNFLRFCQTNYLNISRTDLHQICRVAAVDERSEVSFSLFVKLVDQLTIINRRLGGEYNSYRLCPASSFLLFSPLLSLLRFPSPPTPHIPCSFFYYRYS